MANRYPPPYDPYRQPGAPPPVPPGADPFSPQNRGDMIGGLMMPKTVVQLAIWVLMFGLGAGLAGLLLFIVYQTQVNSLEGRIIDSQAELEKKLDERLDKLEENASAPQASATLNVSAATGGEKIRNDLLRSSASGIVGIQGTDSTGKATSGSGFIVNSTNEGAWVITNYQLVSGSSPTSTGVIVKMGPSELYATVFEVDPGSDLALVIVNVPGKKAMRFTRGDLKQGDTVWVLGSARGNPYATIQEVHLVDYSVGRVVIDADPPVQFNGGPVIDSQGRVVGVLSSRAARTPAKTTGTTVVPAPAAVTRAATPIKNACNVVLRCPGARPKADPAAKPSPAAAASPPPAQQPAPIDQVPAPIN